VAGPVQSAAGPVAFTSPSKYVVVFSRISGHLNSELVVTVIVEISLPNGFS